MRALVYYYFLPCNFGIPSHHIDQNYFLYFPFNHWRNHKGAFGNKRSRKNRMR